MRYHTYALDAAVEAVYTEPVFKNRRVESFPAARSMENYHTARIK